MTDSVIKSFTVTGRNSLTVIWNGWKTAAVEAISSARFKDGQININYTDINRSLRFDDGQTIRISNPLNLTGGAIGIRESGTTYWNFYLSGSWASPHRDFNTIYRIGR